jgi:hypothetical protein
MTKNQISLNNIEAAIELVDNLEDEAMDKIAEGYVLAQPVLFSYVMQAADEYKNDNLAGLLGYYFCLFSETFKAAGFELNQIEEELIDEYEEPFFEALDEYFQSEELEGLATFTDQPELMNFIVVEVSTEDDDGTALDDETSVQLFIVLTAITTLMTKAVKA